MFPVFMVFTVEPLRGSEDGRLPVGPGFRSHSLTAPGVSIIESFRDSLRVSRRDGFYNGSLIEPGVIEGVTGLL